jgi:hypothetical protein
MPHINTVTRGIAAAPASPFILHRHITTIGTAAPDITADIVCQQEIETRNLPGGQS